MGSSVILDIIGSTIIGGMLLTILFTLTDSTAENTYMYGGELNAQQNLVAVVDLLEYDFKRIGYCEDDKFIPNAKDVIYLATENSIAFITDLATNYGDPRGDGVPDTLFYELGELIQGTPNPNDRFLYRYIKGEEKNGSNLGITDLKFTYYDVFKQKATVISDISLIQIDVRIEDVYGYDTANEDKIRHEDKYATVLWRQIRLPIKRQNK